MASDDALYLGVGDKTQGLYVVCNTPTSPAQLGKGEKKGGWGGGGAVYFVSEVFMHMEGEIDRQT